MRNHLPKVALLAAFALPSLAHATDISFEGIDNGYNGGTQVSNGYAGFNYSDVYAIVGSSLAGTGYQNGVTSGISVAYNGYGSQASMTLATAGTFTLNSIEVTSAWDSTQTAIFDGYDGSTLLDTVSVAVNDLTPTLENFDWAGLTSLSFVGADGSQVVLDDMTINQVAVVPQNIAVAAVAPEPNSLILLGTGALGMAGMVRRRISA